MKVTGKKIKLEPTFLLRGDFQNTISDASLETPRETVCISVLHPNSFPVPFLISLPLLFIL